MLIHSYHVITLFMHCQGDFLQVHNVVPLDVIKMIHLANIYHMLLGSQCRAIGFN